MAAYEYEHTVGFEETSFVGNVYFTNYLLWQGHCREMFLRDHAREVLDLLSRREVAFITRRCSCDYGGDFGFVAFDRVLVRMRLSKFRGGRMTLEFAYTNADRPDEVVATGEQEVYCKAQRGGAWVPEPFPVPLIRALQRFADRDDLHEALREALDHHAARSKGAQSIDSHPKL